MEGNAEDCEAWETARQAEGQRLKCTLQVLEEEERNIFAQITRTLASAATLSCQFDLIEALANECQIRTFEKTRLLDSLLKLEKHRSSQLSQQESSLAALKLDLIHYKHSSDRRSHRQRGELPQQSSYPLSALDVYDWVVDISLITDLAQHGWEVEFSAKFWASIDAQQRSEMLQNSQFDWEGAVVAVVGLYDKGKTFVLNNISGSNLPSGKKVNTKGLSFKHVDMDSGTKLILLDTAGSYSPVKVTSEFSVAEKEATELFLLDLVFDISDYFICVVNDFTSLDQRYLDKVSRSLQISRKKTFREVIVLHNLKEVESEDVLQHLWLTQVTQIYGSGRVQTTQVAAVNSNTGELEEKAVIWFKTPYSRHICLANADSELGQTLNPWAFSLLKYWLKAVLIPVNRPVSVVEAVLSFSTQKLSTYFKLPVELKIVEGADALHKRITCTSDSFHEQTRMPQIAIDSSGFVMARPDSFLPLVDVIENGEYCIYMDLPGLTESDIVIIRENVVTVVQGRRKSPYIVESEGLTVVKQERKYGDFTMNFRIPDRYERRWCDYEIKDGVMKIVYKRDQDEDVASLVPRQ